MGGGQGVADTNKVGQEVLSQALRGWGLGEGRWV